MALQRISHIVHIAPSIKWHKLKLQGLVAFTTLHEMQSCQTFVPFSPLWDVRVRNASQWEGFIPCERLETIWMLCTSKIFNSLLILMNKWSFWTYLIRAAANLNHSHPLIWSTHCYGLTATNTHTWASSTSTFRKTTSLYSGLLENACGKKKRGKCLSLNTFTATSPIKWRLFLFQVAMAWQSGLPEQQSPSPKWCSWSSMYPSGKDSLKTTLLTTVH